MFSLFNKHFHKKEPGNGIVSSDQEEKLKVATCAILIEAVTADSEFSDEELNAVVDMLKARLEMNYEQASELINQSTELRRSTTGIWYFTNIINNNLNNEEKYKLLELIWDVIYSDGKLDKFENYMAHKLRNLLLIDHSKFIELKLKVKNEHIDKKNLKSP